MGEGDEAVCARMCAVRDEHGGVRVHGGCIPGPGHTCLRQRQRNDPDHRSQTPTSLLLDVDGRRFGHGLHLDVVQTLRSGGNRLRASWSHGYHHARLVLGLQRQNLHAIRLSRGLGAYTMLLKQAASVSQSCIMGLQ